DFAAGDMVLVSGVMKARAPTVSIDGVTFKNVILVQVITEGRRTLSRRRWLRLHRYGWIPASYKSAASDAVSLGDWHVTPDVLRQMRSDGEVAQPGIDFKLPEGWFAFGDRVYKGIGSRRYYLIWRPGAIYTVIARKSGVRDLVLFDTGLPLDDDYAFVQSGAVASPSVLQDDNQQAREVALLGLMGFFLAAWTALALMRQRPNEDREETEIPLGPMLCAFALTGLLELFCLYLTEGPLFGLGTFIVAALLVAALFFLRGWRRRREQGRSNS
ncbi:MAG TPA: hypothetical protein VH835_14795, partial [Dongiaceae bacterium]